MLTIDGLTVYGDGPTSVLRASNALSSAVILRGAITFSKLKLTSPNAGSRNNAGAAACVLVDRATPFTVRDVSVDRCANSGIIVLGGANGQIVHNDVRNTLSDAIHMTNGSRDIVVTDNIVRNSGDDMIAVVSYVGSSPNAERITIERNDVSGQTSGRGISTVGGNNVTIRDNTISATYGAGVYVAAEDSWNTYGTSNVQVLGNRISDTDNGQLGHGCITVFGRSTYASRATVVSGNTCSDTRRGMLIGAYAVGTQVTGNTFTNATEQGIFLDGPQDTTISDNTISEIQWYGIYAARAVGTLAVRQNRLSNVDKARSGGVDVIHVVQGIAVSSGEVTGNTYSNPGGYPYDKLVQCDNTQIAVSGNTAI